MSLSLTVCAQGSRQHLDALVSDGVSGRQVGRQRAPGRAEAGGHGASRGGGGFRAFGFSSSAERRARGHECDAFWTSATQTAAATHAFRLNTCRCRQSRASSAKGRAEASSSRETLSCDVKTGLSETICDREKLEHASG